MTESEWSVSEQGAIICFIDHSSRKRVVQKKLYNIVLNYAKDPINSSLLEGTKKSVTVI